METNVTGREGLEAALGYHFRDGAQLDHALTHSSSRQDIAPDEGCDNERLELLGDSVLGLVVTEHLQNSFPDWNVGRLSQGKARLVSARSLHSAASRLELGRFLKVGASGEKEGLREQRDLLADAYEALVGAIYLDGGLPAASSFVRRTLLEDAVREQAETLGEPDHKSALMLWLQARGRRLAEFRVVRESGPPHRKRFVVEVRVEGRAIGEAEGGSKKEAEQAAAGLALAQLRDTGDITNG